MRFAVLLLVFLLLIPSTLALVDVTYKFNKQAVEVSAYNCLDTGCTTVTPFSGSFPNGQSTTNGQLKIRYPSTLASQFGYAVYYVSQGQIPIEGWATWSSLGDPGLFQTSYNSNFQQVQNCKSTIDNFQVINAGQPNVPIVINTQARLDASTHAAFFLTQNEVGFVPPQYRNTYYSADTRVTLTIRDANNNIVNQQVQNLVLFADETRQVQFTFTPTTAGSYTATISTDVTDDQCVTATQQSSTKAFQIQNSTPVNQCYTLLNNLALSNPFPRVGEASVTTFTKLSNHADNAGTLHAVPTTVRYLVRSPTRTLLDTTIDLASNPTTTDSVTNSFSWTPTESGQHTVTVTGTANSPLCQGLPNPSETETLNVAVSNQPTFNVRFQISDSRNGSAIPNVTVRFGTVSTTTDGTGQAMFANVSPGIYDYTLSNAQYNTRSGSVTVVNSDTTLLLTMDRTNVPGLHNVLFILTDAITRVPVPNAQVVAGSSAFSNANGQALIQGLPDGTYQFTAQHAGYQSVTGTVTLSGADQTINVSMLPLANGRFTATVIVEDASNHRPIQGASVAVDGLSGTTDTTGTARLSGLVPGVYAASASKQGFITATTTTQVVDKDITLQFSLQSVQEEDPQVGIFVSSIRVPRAFEARPSMPVEVAVNFENNGDVLIEDMHAMIVSQELGLRAAAGPFDLSKNRRITKQFTLELPSTITPGTYPVRITLSKDKEKRVLYRDVEVLR